VIMRERERENLESSLKSKCLLVQQWSHEGGLTHKKVKSWSLKVFPRDLQAGKS
jgi:hypothetical protein